MVLEFDLFIRRMESKRRNSEQNSNIIGNACAVSGESHTDLVLLVIHGLSREPENVK